MSRWGEGLDQGRGEAGRGGPRSFSTAPRDYPLVSAWPAPAALQVSWIPGSTLVAVATADGCLRVWDGRDGRLVANHTGHAGLILDFAVVPAPATSTAAAPPMADAAAASAAPPAAAAAAAVPVAEAPLPPASSALPDMSSLSLSDGASAAPATAVPSQPLVSTAACPLIVTAGDDGVCRVYSLPVSQGGRQSS